jgi:hypothetical protein
MGWEVHPDSFYRLLNRLHFEYRMPQIFVTENGCSYPDGPGENGRVPDQRRINYLDAHLRALHRALQNGAPIAGYMQWSLMDNYEWAEGYSQRFGMVYVDYATQQRIPKDSALWYRDLIARNGLRRVDLDICHNDMPTLGDDDVRNGTRKQFFTNCTSAPIKIATATATATFAARLRNSTISNPSA